MFWKSDFIITLSTYNCLRGVCNVLNFSLVVKVS